jgi:high-affinity iron transporter
MTLATSLVFSGCGGRDADVPARYRNLAVPAERLASNAARAHGRALFLEHCAICHGVNADGHGIRAEGLSPSPVDFTNPGWRESVGPRRVFSWIREGVPGTAMPSWDILDDRQTWDLVAYLLSVGKS